jgi:hypothetical protein
MSLLISYKDRYLNHGIYAGVERQQTNRALARHPEIKIIKNVKNSCKTEKAVISLDKQF